MQKEGKILIIILTLLIGVYIALCYYDRYRYESHLGDPVIINGEILIVVDFSMWDETYTLSNGVIVDRRLTNFKINSK